MIKFVENRAETESMKASLEEVKHIHMKATGLLLETEQVKKETKVDIIGAEKAREAMMQEKLAKGVMLHKVLAVGEHTFNCGVYAGCHVMLVGGSMPQRFTVDNVTYLYVELHEVMFHTEPVEQVN